MVMKYVNWALRRAENRPLVPVCPDHDVTMRFRGIQGRPARFDRQSEEEYTLIYFCPVDDCDQSRSVTTARSQAPVPGEAPARPVYARRQEY